MEREVCDTPKKKSTMFSTPVRSPSSHQTPVRDNQTKRRHPALNIFGDLAMLPTHITPPSGLTKFIARNPFDADLTSRLHLSVISPTFFSKTQVNTTVSQDSPEFSWNVDELALIRPAKIEEYPVQQMHSSDPDLERTAQAAIHKFFHENQIIPSPCDTKRKISGGTSDMETPPSRLVDDGNVTREFLKTKKDCWSQTVLTLPPVLPKEVEEALKPYFTFNQDQNIDNEEANLSNSSLRRKLFFNHEETSDDEDSFCLSPVPGHASILLQSSPPGTGIVHGTPLMNRLRGLQTTDGTPYAANMSPPDMSPICNRSVSVMSCQSDKSRVQFAARLDFTADMSVDVSFHDDKIELSRIEDAEFNTSGSMLRPNLINARTDSKSDTPEKLQNNDDKSPASIKTSEMMSPVKTPLKHEEIIETNVQTSKNNEILDRLKIAADWCKTHSNESYAPQNSILLGHSVSSHQSAFNSAQDTGYQTYSMSNITGNTDNCSITPVKQKIHWDTKVSQNDEIKLSDWQDNMNNMFSSTPSKYTRRRDI